MPIAGGIHPVDHVILSRNKCANSRDGILSSLHEVQGALRLGDFAGIFNLKRLRRNRTSSPSCHSRDTSSRYTCESLLGTNSTISDRQILGKKSVSSGTLFDMAKW